VLTLPKPLQKIPGGTHGHFFLEPSTVESLAGSTVATSGYASGECTRDFTMDQKAVLVEARWASTQWQASGKVEPAKKPLSGYGNFLHHAATCADMMGSPMWKNTDRLNIVAMQLFSDFPDYEVGKRLSVGFALRPEILDVVRQRVSLDQVRPTF
jgi:hypothetical protein